MKYIPNIISSVRLFLSLVLIVLSNNVYVFCAIYLLCGISDILDGYIARKTNTQSITGARLDSVADIIMFFVMLAVMIQWAGIELTAFIPIISIIIVIRCTSIVIAVCKYHTVVMLHTWGNKLAGLLIYFIPLVYIWFGSLKFILFACVIALISTIEECIINITSDKPDLNWKSIFKLKEK